MSSKLYQTLPPPPKQISAGAILSRLIDGLGFRYQLATNNLTDNEINFRPAKGSMSMLELLDHIYKVLFWAYNAFDKNAKSDRSLKSYDDYRNSTLQVCFDFQKRLLEMSDDEIEQVSVYLKRTNTAYSFWYLINGQFRMY